MGFTLRFFLLLVSYGYPIGIIEAGKRRTR